MTKNNTSHALLAAMAQTRKNFYLLMKQYSIDQINHIPEGFNNNLLWNFGHILVTQQLLCYSLSNLPMLVEDHWIAAYRKGSKPEAYVKEEEYGVLLDFSKSSLVQLESDLSKGVFEEYKEYETSFGLKLTSIQDALSFNALHETMHLGYAMALSRALKNQV